MDQILNYKGKLLVSKPILYGDFFHRSVIYIVEDNFMGTIGFILNKSLNEFIQNYISTIQSKNIVFEGGPVSQNNIYYFHSRPDLITDSVHLYNNIFWSGKFIDIQKAIQQKKLEKNEMKFFLGYSGWEKGQLHKEIIKKLWVEMEDSTIDLLKSWDHNLWKLQLEKLGGEHLIWINTPKDPMLN